MNKLYFKLSLIFILMSICFSVSVHGQYQNALDFDGVDDQASVPLASSLIAGSSELSMSCWVYPTNPAPSFPNFDGFCGFRNDLDADFYLVQIGATDVEARFRGVDGISRNIVYTGLVLNTWNHFVFTKDANQIILYHNGVAVDLLSSSSVISNANEDFFIGSIPYASLFYRLTGRVDEVALWDRQILPNEIGCIYTNGVSPNSSNLKLHFTMNQGTAGSVNSSINSLMDFSSSHMDAVLSGLSLSGSTSNFVSGTETYVLLAGAICEGEQYQFGTQTISVAGSYLEAFPGSGCDSVVQLILAVDSISLDVSVNNETLTADQAGGTYQWLDCNNGYSAILNAIDRDFTPMQNGNYAVLVSYGNCSDTSACQVMTSVGISTNKFNDEINVFPNPFESQLIINPGQSFTGAAIEVHSILGDVIYNGTIDGSGKHSISTENWSKGVYIMKIYSFEAQTYRYLVKD